MKINWSFLFLIVFAASCEAPGYVDGKVIDAQTQEPIDSVKCNVITGREIEYTDSSGKFSVSNRTSPCPTIGGKKDITVEYSKEGYQTLQSSKLGGNVVISLEKE